MNIKDALQVVEEKGKGNSFVYNCVIDDLVETLAAELRRLTTLKPMDEAPDERAVFMLDGVLETGRTCDSGYAHTEKGEIRFAAGWLPLPNPEDYK
jgi:hypothetical protein